MRGYSLDTFSTALLIFIGYGLSASVNSLDGFGVSDFVFSGGAIFMLIWVSAGVREMREDLIYCQHFLEKKYGQDPCDPGSDLYKEIRKSISRPRL